MICRDDYATGEEFALWRCRDCGFLLTQEAPVEAEIGRYYETPDYISHSDTHRGLMNRVYHWVRHFMLTRKARLVEQSVRRVRAGKPQVAGQPLSALDIGTGTGYFPHTLQQRGWQVSAIEKSAQAREFARTHFQLEVQPDEALWSHQLDAKRFDAITLWHVMEHLEHLNDVWDRLHRLLKDDGALVVAVPNPTGYDARHYGARWAAYDTPRHLWHFAPAVMAQLAARHGFEWMATHPMPFDAFYVSMLTEKYRGSKGYFWKGLCVGLRAWLSSWGRKEQSSSLIYIFRKKNYIQEYTK
jgi:2-polyprenyl-3-methyl-5-hydroxy-6-metoxy-1,4-benzoquinol methylase